MNFFTELLSKRPPWLDNANTVLLFIAVFCLIYYVLAGFAFGFGVANLWIWLGATGLFSLRPLIFFVLHLMEKDARNLFPSFVKIPIYVLFFAFLAYFAVFEAVLGFHSFAKGKENLDYVIVLGAKVNGTKPSNALRYRIDKAAQYLKENPTAKVIASGGQGEDEGISEAECIKRELIKKGIDENRIILEDRSTSTYENFLFSLQIINDEKASVGIVTNSFHLFRAGCLARTAGSNRFYSVSAPYKGLLAPHYFAREFVSFNADLIFGHINPSRIFN